MSSPLWSGSGYQGRHGGDSLRRMAAMPAPDGNPIPKPAPAPTVPAVEEQAPEVTAPVAEEIPQPAPAVPVPSSPGVRIPDRGVRTDMRARVLRTLTGGRASIWPASRPPSPSVTAAPSWLPSQKVGSGKPRQPCSSTQPCAQTRAVSLWCGI